MTPRTIKNIAMFSMFMGASGVISYVNAQTVNVEAHNVVQLSASATVDVPQDWLTITLTVTRDGTDAATVQQQLRQALDGALTLARSVAKPGAMEVKTGQFSLQPRYGKEGRIVSWLGSAELILEGRDFVQLGATAGKIQSLVVSNTSFSLSREARAKVEDDAQTMAIERYKARATDIAHDFGFNGYVLRDVSVNSNEQGYVPRPRMMAMEMK